MKLFFLPGSCAIAAHIALFESGQPFESEAVFRETRLTASGVDFYTINPKGYVPALQLDNGEVLTESVAVLTYIAMRSPKLAAGMVQDGMEYFRLIESLAFISSEIYRNFAILFRPNLEETRQAARDLLVIRLDLVEKQLGGRDYMLGNRFTVVDAYLFTTLYSGRFVNFDLGRWPSLQRYVTRLEQRASVRSSLEVHGVN